MVNREVDEQKLEFVSGRGVSGSWDWLAGLACNRSSTADCNEILDLLPVHSSDQTNPP